MARKLISIVMSVIMMTSMLVINGCSRPADIDDKMPQVWEEGFYDIAVSFSELLSDENEGEIVTVDPLFISLDNIKEVTVSVKENFHEIGVWYNEYNLENIYVEEGHPSLLSLDGVVYSKSMETLVKWPAKKRVTQLPDSVKYLMPYCYAYCEIPEDFELPNGIVSIGTGAFSESTLKNVNLGKDVRTVNINAFSTETIKRIEISTPIVYRNFYCYPSIENLKFNEGVLQIRVGDKSYIPNSSIMVNLKTVEFPDSLRAIGNVCFPVNIAVEKYELKGSIGFIDEYAFHDYSYVKNITENMDKSNRSGKYRCARTIFESDNKIVKEYLKNKICKWEKNWEYVIKDLEEQIIKCQNEGDIVEAKELTEYLHTIKKLLKMED